MTPAAEARIRARIQARKNAEAAKAERIEVAKAAQRAENDLYEMIADDVSMIDALTDTERQMVRRAAKRYMEIHVVTALCDALDDRDDTLRSKAFRVCELILARS